MRDFPVRRGTVGATGGRPVFGGIKKGRSQESPLHHNTLFMGRQCSAGSLKKILLQRVDDLQPLYLFKVFDVSRQKSLVVFKCRGCDQCITQGHFSLLA